MTFFDPHGLELALFEVDAGAEVDPLSDAILGFHSATLAAVVLVHGRGASAQSMVSLAEDFKVDQDELQWTTGLLETLSSSMDRRCIPMSDRT